MIKKILLIVGTVAGLLLIGYGGINIYHFLQIPKPTSREQGHLYGAAFVGFIGIILIVAVAKNLKKRAR